MPLQNPSNQEIKKVLEQAQSIVVVGLSNKPERTSYQISRAMQQVGYKIIPVNPNVGEVLGVKAYNSLSEIEEPFEIINVFRRSNFLPEIAQEAVQTKAKVFWAQQGVYNEDAYEYLKKHDFTVIMDMCIKVAHSVILGK